MKKIIVPSTNRHQDMMIEFRFEPKYIDSKSMPSQSPKAHYPCRFEEVKALRSTADEATKLVDGL